MEGILNWLKGKRTYVVALAVAALAGLTAYGIETPEWVWLLLNALGLGTLRVGISGLKGIGK